MCTTVPMLRCFRRSHVDTGAGHQPPGLRRPIHHLLRFRTLCFAAGTGKADRTHQLTYSDASSRIAAQVTFVRLILLVYNVQTARCTFNPEWTMSTLSPPGASVSLFSALTVPLGDPPCCQVRFGHPPANGRLLTAQDFPRTSCT